MVQTSGFLFMNSSSVFRFYNRSSFYLQRRVYFAGLAAAALFVLSYFMPLLFEVALALLALLTITILIDIFLLYGRKRAITVNRLVPDRLSNGDENKISIELSNEYHFKIRCRMIDELPCQFQERDWKKDFAMDAQTATTLDYTVKPVQRGVYEFGAINVYVTGPLNLVIRRYSFRQEEEVKVYPSYMQMRRYQLLAAANRLDEVGMQRLRKLGHSMEFEQIKEYVRGDDYRTINWKATARRGDLMVNNYTDERSQQVYCLINKGRTMKMPFDGMTLLDYAINSTLVLSNTAILKQDKAGLITFDNDLDTFLPADKKPGQMNQVLELLYKQETDFLEPDYEKLFSAIRNRITQRSLLVLFTNYESIESLERDLPSLKRIAHYHLLMVIFFENTELQQLAESKAGTIEDIYIKTIAEKYRHEKRLIAKELQKHGIIAVLTTPKKLTINALNKYLELKNRQSI